MVLSPIYSTGLTTQLRYVPDAHFYSGTDICLGNFLEDRDSSDHFRIGSSDFPVLCRHSTADLFLAEKQISDRLTIFSFHISLHIYPTDPPDRPLIKTLPRGVTRQRKGKVTTVNLLPQIREGQPISDGKLSTIDLDSSSIRQRREQF